MSTATGKERLASREAIAILAESLELLGGPKRDEDDNKATSDKDTNDAEQNEQDKATDISALLKAEVDDMKDRSKQDFTVRDMGLPSTIFLACNFSSPSPSEILYHALESVRKSGQNKTRFCFRWAPVEYTCRAELESLKEMGKTVADEFFGSDREEKTFSVDVQLRAKPKELERMDVIDAFAGSIDQPPWKVDLNAPDLTVLVNVVKGTAGCAVLRGYRELARYNLSLLAKPADDESDEEQVEKKSSDS